MAVLSQESIPMLSPHVSLNDGSTLVMESPHARYEFCGRAGSIVRKAMPWINEGFSLREIEGMTGTELTSLIEVLAVLTDDDLVDVSQIVASSTTDQFMPQYFRLCDEWARYIFASPFWEAMFAGQASRQHVLGWGVEFYHRTLGADEHNQTSMDRCNADDQVRQWLVEHFQEEFGHGDMFLRGLVACGLDREGVLHSKPLPTTRSLIEYFNDLAAHDTIAYLGCYGVLHSPRVGQTADQVRSQFGCLMSHYPFATGILGAIQEHALLDLELEHNQIVLERLAARERAFPPDVGMRILQAAKGSVQAFSRYFDGIWQYYGLPGSTLLRTTRMD